MSHRGDTRSLNGRNALVAALFFIFMVWSAAGSLCAAGPVHLTDAELSGVTGQAGITIWTDGTARLTSDVIKISDSSTLNWLELRNLVVDDGNGGYFSWATPLDMDSVINHLLNPASPIIFDPVTLDVVTKAAWTETTTTLIPDEYGILPNSGDPGYIPTYETIEHPAQALVVTQDSTRVSPRWYSVGKWDPVHAADPDGGLVGGLVFCDQSLGSLHLDALSMGPSLSRYGAHADGSSGVDFDYETKIYAQAFRYTYNSALEALTLSGIHFSGSATGDPVDPATWAFSGNFKIGDIDSGNPAKMDIVTDFMDTNLTSIVLSLPMQGSLRVENVAFGGNNFGPIALDGIQVHRLSLQIF